ncbi:hypothetical protein [Delftia sp. UME58]|uniref:hypothetical protein n=1 Tax=Delftia sp. UME58 TaxID=1862322 RepID=UPI001601DE74|nr:hypothetical protein [Delftia sp. UME58]MBB1647964.1 hypothetical protein [Delftia sp. UME58]
MAKISVPVQPTKREMQRHLQSLLDDEVSAFRGTLDLDVSHVDMRAQVYGVRISDVELGATTIGVSYEVDYNVFNGCKDMDIDDSEEGFVEGVLTDGGWRFEELVPPPKRSTVDEF